MRCGPPQGGETISKEIEEIQAEMARVHAKYIANPTPENMMKLNNELMALSMKMNEAAMRGEGGAAYAIDDEEDYDIEKFIKDNRPPKDKEKYLPIGALLIVPHDEPWQTFATTVGEDYWMVPLMNGWGLKNAKGGRDILASLLGGRHYKEYGENFKKLKAGQPNKLNGESAEGYRDTLDAIKQHMPALLPKAEKCDNILAWDLDRVGYLARVFANIGWIPEAEMYEWLEKAAARIRSEYSDWEEYILSVAIGRGVAFNFDEEIIEVAAYILNEGKALMKAHPLKDL
jgi:hypothetical protein